MSKNCTYDYVIKSLKSGRRCRRKDWPETKHIVHIWSERKAEWIIAKQVEHLSTAIAWRPSSEDQLANDWIVEDD